MAKRTVTLVLDDLTMGDMEAFEEATGLDLLDELAPKPVIDPDTKMPVKDPSDPKGRPLMRVRITPRVRTALVFLGIRHEDPSVTIGDVRAMRLSEIDFDLRTGDDSPLDENAPPDDNAG